MLPQQNKDKAYIKILLIQYNINLHKKKEGIRDHLLPREGEYNKNRLIMTFPAHFKIFMIKTMHLKN